MRRLTTLLLVLLVVLAAASLHDGRPARAAFPGANGRIAFVSNREGTNGDIWVMETDGSQPMRIVPDTPPFGLNFIDTTPAWSPDGSQLAFVTDRTTGGSAFTMDLDGSNMQATQVAYSRAPSWSPDGSKLVVDARIFSPQLPYSDDLYVVDLSTHSQANVTQSAQDEVDAAWSPDGTKFAFVVSQGPGSSDIVVSDVNGANAVNLTDIPGADSGPNWSHDGSKIAFHSDRDGDYDVYVMDQDGSNVSNLTSNSAALDGEPAWSPDGSRLVFSSDRDGNFEIYVMSADGGGQTNLTNQEAYDHAPDWQPIPLGDVTCGNGVNSIDAALILQLDARLVYKLPCQDAADVNLDGRMNSLDAFLLLQFNAGLITSLPP